MSSTNYFLSLTNEHYPLRFAEIAYTPSITVIKDKNYNYLPNPFCVSALAGAGIKGPTLNYDGSFTDNDYKITETIIDNIFRTCYLYEHDVLILGALGCGAYGNPPEHVVNIFNEYLQKYWGCFKKIYFAVYSTSKYDENFIIFSQLIETKKI